MALARGERPGRPEGMSDWLWDLASRCSHQVPENRPHMDEVEKEVSPDSASHSVPVALFTLVVDALFRWVG